MPGSGGFGAGTKFKPFERDAKPAKRIKQENKVDTRWEWEADGGIWTAFPEDLSEQLTDCLTSGEKRMEFDLSNGVSLVLIFDRMVQKNKKTGWDRRVRCAVKDSKADDFYVWQWEDERGGWNPYQAAVCLTLEESQAGGDTSVSISACGRDYTIDTTLLEQTNDATGVVRKVARIKSGAEIPSGSSAVKPSTNGASASAKASTSRSGTETTASSAAPEETSKTKVKGRSGAKSGRAGSVKVKEETEEENVKTVILKGKAPVDAECAEKVGVAHVYSEGSVIYDVMLNQTNIQQNNNKFFIIQLLQDDNRKAFSVWFRWGRVGLRGQTNLVACGPDVEEAKKVFCKKFSDKTKNDWADRAKFKKVSGKYALVHIDYDVKNEEEEEEEEARKGDQKAVGKKAKSSELPESTLDVRLQALINLICDVKRMEEAVVEMKYDSRKMPLGKLTTKQIKAGYAALKVIAKCIERNDFGQNLTQACSDFYTRIPHCFGMQRPPTLRTIAEVKAKIEMLEALSDIEIAMKIIKEEGGSNTNPIDNHYLSLKCGLTPLDSRHPEFDLVRRYVANTHAPTHNQYTMKVANVFKANKENEEENFNDVGNRMLLWHGSRLTNWVGILSQGLRIAPPEAPVTGYMFGKGVYFADVSSKSANYCFASPTRNTGLLLLCEVALGTSNDLLAADYQAASLPAGKHSVRGLGAMAPDPRDNHVTDDGVTVPLGQCIKTGVKNPNGYTLNYNEFIVYDTAQIRMRYLVQVEFLFK